MVDLLERGSDWLEDQRTKFMARTVTYQRAPGTSVEVLATIGKTMFDVDNGAGVLLRVETRDYLILAVDIVLDGQQTPPKQGDLIIETKDSKQFRYEVMAPGGAPHFRYSDPYRKTLRIHTRLIAEEVI